MLTQFQSKELLQNNRHHHIDDAIGECRDNSQQEGETAGGNGRHSQTGERRGAKSQQEGETAEEMKGTHKLERGEGTGAIRREKLQRKWEALTNWREKRGQKSAGGRNCRGDGRHLHPGERRGDKSQQEGETVEEMGGSHILERREEEEERGQESSGGRNCRGDGRHSPTGERRGDKSQQEGETAEGMGGTHPLERGEGTRVNRREKLQRGWETLTSWREERGQESAGGRNCRGDGMHSPTGERRRDKSQQEGETTEGMGDTHKLERGEGTRVSRREKLQRRWEALTHWREERGQESAGGRNCRGYGRHSLAGERRGDKSQQEGVTAKGMAGTHPTGKRRGDKSQQEGETAEEMGDTHPLERGEGTRVSRGEKLQRGWEALTCWRGEGTRVSRGENLERGWEALTNWRTGDES
ncbi:hypothetical protein BT96DRAFT_1008098 [Gymnopus androsaceus JB14]|uniref:Uncharacterized protein n=1 Tax=Gymnopus androsaceus JB14 TaxID=1447944 RepID=A0A6A4GG40_9AGAR|nr:hypothetical protein BT96DRAFT_1008098 [Gymnopus androsaceus JB14]